MGQTLSAKWLFDVISYFCLFTDFTHVLFAGDQCAPSVDSLQPQNHNDVQESVTLSMHLKIYIVCDSGRGWIAQP